MTPPSDKIIWDLFFSQFHLAAVSVADEIGLLAAINENTTEIDELSEKISLSTRGTESLCLVLKALGLINKKMNTLMDIAKTYFIPSSPYYWGAVLHAYRKNEIHQRIITGLRQQKALELDGRSLTDMWRSGDITPAAAKSFTAGMECMGAAPAAHAVSTEAFCDLKSLLDMGGGSGVFARAFLQKNPQAHATVFDLPDVISEAKQYQQRFSPKHDMRYIAGNFFEDKWPENQEAILLASILHDWSPTEGKYLLEKAHASLQRGGRLIIHEMLLDDEHISEINTAFFDLLMCINHGSQQYKKDQLMELLRDIGFKNVSYCQGSACHSLIYADK